MEKEKDFACRDACPSVELPGSATMSADDVIRKSLGDRLCSIITCSIHDDDLVAGLAERLKSEEGLAYEGSFVQSRNDNGNHGDGNLPSQR